ncbi:hypothetical protein QN355_11640 [Cryobacterium sp. 10S3]|uniref:hypothetical protein n=1 Tax=Cryobacterium sp. 10S3 TaxID=3048582 RepID=UPI002AC94784|nr:hypothetical protein [Cryobacterium sp. 10S3]MEB0287206.1 hypothetical protein [Cryobacterium sp. 10S3]WPX14161.1 hypothetical protein RHM57_01960 [Cryobacterium sp. 10S3]
MTDIKEAKIKVDGYGDMIAAVTDTEMIFQREIGSYQGEYIVVTRDESARYFFYIGSYGSCSGCDFLEGERDYDGFIEYKTALDYVAESKPQYVMPAMLLKSLDTDLLHSTIKGMFDSYDADDFNIKDAAELVKAVMEREAITTTLSE